MLSLGCSAALHCLASKATCCQLAPLAQAKELSRRPHVVIATPGRLRALLEMDAELARGFSRARFLVLDEADRLLEPSFESELAVVLQVGQLLLGGACWVLGCLVLSMRWIGAWIQLLMPPVHQWLVLADPARPAAHAAVQCNHTP